MIDKIACFVKLQSFMAKLMLNIDTQEIANFEMLAKDWWDPQGPCKPLHGLNPIRLQFIQQHMASLTGKKTLDLGCGGGILTESLAKLGAITTGIDAAPNLINIAIQHSQAQQLIIDYQNCTAEELAKQHPQAFDIITCMEMLEHVPDPYAILQACAILLKPGGHLFLSTLNRNLKSYLFAILGAEYILKLLPKGTHRYEQFIRPAELAEWLRKTGFELKNLQGLAYKPITQGFRLSSNISVNYLAYCHLSL
jgi:2-polyprenyl-6-hydroxyphenyl methylase/3-demethylubiquinone-9 3-methyltransferase